MTHKPISRIVFYAVTAAVLIQGIVLCWFVFRPWLEPETIRIGPGHVFIGKPQDNSPASRVTNILVFDEEGNSAILRSLSFSEITSVSGTVTLKTNPMRFGNSSGMIRFNSGNLEFSEDDGGSWTAF